MDGANGLSNPSFKTKFTEADDYVKGYYVLPEGAITNQYLTLSKATYDLVLKPKDYVIDYHIPSNKPCTIDDMKKTFEMTRLFFKTHYPEYHYKAFWSSSWLSSPQILFFLKNPLSNIVRISKQSYTLPAKNGQDSLFNFIFKTPTVDFEKIQLNTSLEKGIGALIKQGGRINCGTFLYCTEDLDEFGKESYRTEETFRRFINLTTRALKEAIK